jgi:hypothetical protein
MKRTHTHRGHCQLCGAVQALDPDTSLIAKHGYTVPDGYFVGTCPGSDHPNLHVARDLADASIQRAREKAIVMEVTARDYELREADPPYVFSGYTRMVKPWGKPKERTSYDWGRGTLYVELREERIDVPYAEARPKYQELGRTAAILDLRQGAQRQLNYADNLEGFANEITGKVEPFKVSDLRLLGFKVGDVVRIGGKKGYDAKIEAIEDREYKVRGWGRRTSKIPHACFTRPAREEKRSATGYVLSPAYPAMQIWEPLRFLKKREQS